VILLSILFWLAVSVLFHEAGHVAVARIFGFRFGGFDTNGGFGVRSERWPARGIRRREVALISLGGPCASLLFAMFVWAYHLSPATLFNLPVVASANVALAILCAWPYGDSDGRKILDSVTA